MTLGLVARGDRGGLAAETYTFWKWLKPERTVLLDLKAAGRGPTHPDRFAGPGLHVTDDWQRFSRDADRLFDGATQILTAETWYDPALPDWAAAHDIETIMCAHPELYDPGFCRADRLWLPTPWMVDRMPSHAEVVPIPIDLDLHPYRARTEAARTFFHPGAPAMLDRNGCDALWDSLQHVQSEVRVVVRNAPSRPGRRRVPDNVTVEYLDEVERTEDVIPDDTDVMVLPRRYGGACFPLWEAAARGIPVLMPDLSPQNEWLPAPCLIPLLDAPPEPARMKGGTVPVFSASPRWLAEMIDWYAEDASLVGEMSRAVRDYAESISWEALLPTYEKLLGR